MVVVVAAAGVVVLLLGFVFLLFFCCICMSCPKRFGMRAGRPNQQTCLLECMGKLKLKLHNSCRASNEREVVCPCTRSATYLSILDFRLVMVGTHENNCPTFSDFPLIERKNLNTLRTDFIETKKKLFQESLANDL